MSDLIPLFLILAAVVALALWAHKGAGTGSGSLLGCGASLELLGLEVR